MVMNLVWSVTFVQKQNAKYVELKLTRFGFVFVVESVYVVDLLINVWSIIR